MTSLILNNAKLILEAEIIEGHIVAKDGVITEIGHGPTQVAGAHECDSAYVCPGLIELHTDNLERHIEPRPETHWPEQAAILAHDAELASVGITTVYDALRVGSILSGKKGDYRKYARHVANEILSMQRAGHLKISHFLHLRAELCSETLDEELEEFTIEDRIGLVSIMNHAPGQRQFRDIDKLRTYAGKKRGMNEEEFQEHIATLLALDEENAQRFETAAVAFANSVGAVLASHDDTTSQHVAHSASIGMRLAEFPTTLEAAQACRDHGIQVIMGGPNIIRGGSHSGNIAAHTLAEHDLIDILSSDYVPSSLLSSAMILAQIWGDVPRAIATVTANPARGLGLTDRGTLDIGKRADFVQITQTKRPFARHTWSRGVQVG
ncbi:MAG: alpha-D-ribose 1-methylphosphonate 5-triphosphate diphosphatase [Paracoccaceae bacterium]